MQAQWSPLGDEGFSPGEASYQSMAVNSSGTPYVVFSDQSNGGKLTVMKYDGTNWTTVGTAGFSPHTARWTDIAFDNSDVPYVSYAGQDNYKICVMKYNGTAWVNVGQDGIVGGSISHLVIRNNVLFLNNGGTKVLTFNGTNWVQVGGDFTTKSITGTDFTVNSTGTPYVVFGEYVGTTPKTTVMRFDGTNWVDVGPTAFSEGESWNQTIAIDGNDIPYVSYKDYAHEYKALVKKFNGADWVTVGTDGFSKSIMEKPRLAFKSDNTPVLSFRSYYAGEYWMETYQFNGTAWDQLGLTYGPGINFVDMAIDGSDTPYVVFQDGEHGNKTTVLKFHPCVAPDVPTLASNSTTFCKGEEVIMWVQSGNLNSATEWRWYLRSGSDYYSVGTGDTLTATAYSSRTYYVRGDGGCDFSSGDYAEISITVNDPPSVYATADKNPVCEGESVTLTGHGDADTYTWDKGVTDGVPFIPPVGTTTYTVTGTNTTTGCSSTYEKTITVNPLPTVNGGDDRTVCEGSSVMLSGSGNADSYSWDHGVTDGQPFTPPTGSTQYVVTGTITATGCSNTDTVMVLANPLPTVNAGTDQAVCDGESVTLQGSGTADTYTWDNGVTDGVSFKPPLGTTTFTVTGTVTATGCRNTDQVKVTVHPLPNVDAGADQTVCDGETVTLTATGANTYTWDKGVVNGQPFLPPAGTTTYTVTGTVTATGCSNTDQTDVTVNPRPQVKAGDDITVCEGESVTLNGSGADTYVWDHGVTDGVPFTPPVGTTTYTVTGTLTATGCSNTDQVTVTVNPLPDVNAGEDLSVHEGEQVTLTATGADTYSWDHGVVNGVPFTPPLGSTTYTVTGTVTATGCSNTDQVVVNVDNKPLSGSFTIGAQGDFPSFRAAVDSMKQVGIKDSAIFTVAAGTYEEHLLLRAEEISRSPAGAPVVFRAASPDSGSVVLQYDAQDLSSDYLIVLDGIGYVTLEGITFKALNTDHATIIRLLNVSSGNIIRGNIFIGSPDAGSLIYSEASSINEENRICDNRFYYGEYGVFLSGTDEAHPEQGSLIRNNLFSGQHTSSLVLKYQTGARAERNKILHTELVETTWSGIFSDHCTSLFAANNVISFRAEQQTAGIVLIATSQTKIYYNSVYITGAATDSRCFNMQDGSSDIVLMNNVLSNASGGLAVYAPDNSKLTSDHNSFFTTGDKLLYANQTSYDLNLWQTAYKLDMHSYETDPAFVSADSLYTTDPLLNGTAAPLTEVTTDLTGQPRDATHPDMGAYEFDGKYVLGKDTTICNNTTVTLDAGAGYDSYLWNTGATTQTLETTPQTGGEAWYKVTVTVGNDSYSDSVRVTSTGPTVDLGADTTICEGNILTLDAGPGESYLWSDGSTGRTLEVSTTDYYSVTVTDTLGCTDEDDIQVVTATPQMVALWWANNRLEASYKDGLQYSWYRDGTFLTSDSGYVYTPDVTGDYHVEVLDEHTCNIISDTLHITVSGIQTMPDNGLTIYPNPASGYITIRFDMPVPLSTVKVFNTLGEMVSILKIDSDVSQVAMDLSDQPEGIYLLRIEKEDRVITRRIIIKR